MFHNLVFLISLVIFATLGGRPANTWLVASAAADPIPTVSTPQQSPGTIIMANGANTFASSSSSASTSSSGRVTSDGQRQTECSATATVTVEVNGQHKSEHDEKHNQQSGDACAAGAKARATLVVRPDGSTDSE